MEVISRNDAKAKNLKHFFTGTPCRNGHKSTREVKNGSCRQCNEERHIRYRERNKQALVERSTKWNNKNRGSLKRSRDKYRKENKYKVQASNNARYARKIKAMPGWADKKAIEEFYRKSQELTETTKIPHNVDHIIPLRGNTVCGLHVETNLQVITANLNRKKNNKFGGENAR